MRILLIFAFLGCSSDAKRVVKRHRAAYPPTAETVALCRKKCAPRVIVMDPREPDGCRCSK